LHVWINNNNICYIIDHVNINSIIFQVIVGQDHGREKNTERNAFA